MIPLFSATPQVGNRRANSPSASSNPPRARIVTQPRVAAIGARRELIERGGYPGTPPAEHHGKGRRGESQAVAGPEGK
jgi:hypothetical protein